MIIRIPESVIFQLEKHRFDQAKKDIEYILEFNKAKDVEKIEAILMLESFKVKQNSKIENKLKEHNEKHEQA
jgi:hypothetical protein